MFKRLKKAWKRFTKGFKNFTFMDILSIVAIVAVSFFNPMYGLIGLGIYVAGQVNEGSLIEQYEQILLLQDKQNQISESIEDANTFEPEWLAGGEFYNQCFAGGKLLNTTSLINPHYKIIREEQPNLDLSFFDKINFPYSYNAGNPNFYDSVTSGIEVSYPSLRAS